MDIAGTALGVASAAATAILAITKLIIEARDLKDELQTTQAELRSIEGVLFVIADNCHNNAWTGSVISAPLAQRLTDVIQRSQEAISETMSLVRRYSDGGLRRIAQWFIVGKNEVLAMQARLAVCKQDLDLGLSMLNISLSSAAHMDTVHIVQSTSEMQRDVQHIITGIRSLQDDHAKMDELLVLLRSLSTNASQNVMLDRFVEHLTDYAQTIYERTTIDPDELAYAALPSRPPQESNQPTQSAEEDWDSVFSNGGSIGSPNDTKSDTTVKGSTGGHRLYSFADFSVKFSQLPRKSHKSASLPNSAAGRPTRKPSPGPFADADEDEHPQKSSPSTSQPAAADWDLTFQEMDRKEAENKALREQFRPTIPVTTKPEKTAPISAEEQRRTQEKLKLNEALRLAIQRIYTFEVSKLLNEGADPNAKFCKLQDPCCDKVVSSPLQDALATAISHDSIITMEPIINILLHRGARFTPLRPFGRFITCPQGQIHPSSFDLFIRHIGKTLPQEDDLHNHVTQFKFSTQYYETPKYRTSLNVAGQFINYGFDPNCQEERLDAPLYTALGTYNPAMASIVVSNCEATRPPKDKYAMYTKEFTVMLVRNILIAHRCQQTAPWIRHIVAADPILGAHFLCQTIMLFSQVDSPQWDIESIIVAIWALIRFDANPTIRLGLSFEREKTLLPSTAFWIRRPKIVTELGVINALELIDRVYMRLHVSDAKVRARVGDILKTSQTKVIIQN